VPKQENLNWFDLNKLPKHVKSSLQYQTMKR